MEIYSVSQTNQNNKHGQHSGKLHTDNFSMIAWVFACIRCLVELYCIDAVITCSSLSAVSWTHILEA